MAKGLAFVSKGDVAVGITGLAGPDGGTEKKPVGLVYIACSVKGGDGAGVSFFRKPADYPGGNGVRGSDVDAELHSGIFQQDHLWQEKVARIRTNI